MLQHPKHPPWIRACIYVVLAHLYIFSFFWRLSISLLRQETCMHARRTLHRAFKIVSSNHLPEVLARVRCAIRLAFIHDRRESGAERAVADVGMAYDPAHVWGGPPHIVSRHPVDGRHGPTQGGYVTPSRPQDAFRLAFGMKYLYCKTFYN